MSTFGSKFNFGDNNSSSEQSDSDASSDERQDEQIELKKNEQQINTAKKQYGMGDSDDELQDRVVISNKEKKVVEMDKILAQMTKHCAGRVKGDVADFELLMVDFNKLKDFLKLYKEIVCNGSEKLPTSVLRVLVLLQKEIECITGSVKKKMEKVNSLNSTKMKARFKEFLTDVENVGGVKELDSTNKKGKKATVEIVTYEQQLEAFKLNPKQEDEADTKKKAKK